MTQSFIVACVQANSERDIEPNLNPVSDLVLQAREAGAEFILLPENISMMEPTRKGILEKASPQSTHPALIHFRNLAEKTEAWLLVGSLAIQLSERQVANRSFLLNSKGGIVAHYDKIHMFDVDLEDGESYQESKIYRSGEQAVMADTPWGPVGLSICYDLRFPHLYRTLAQAGAKYLTVPSAFTRTTGKAHWHELIRSRAIENGAYLLAPAQCGTHAGNRQTFGHSLIVDPWGKVLADGDDEVGVVLAEIDPKKVDEARRKIPSLHHDKPFVLSSVPKSPKS